MKTASAKPGELPAQEPWDFWNDDAHSPAANMALDEALLLTAPERSRPLLRFYSWDRSAVTIGYVQKFSAAPANGFAVVRRPTGGGVVFHDHDFTYTVVIPAGHWLTSLDPTRSYDWINRAILAGLADCGLESSLKSKEGNIPESVDRRTMVCFKNPTRYDILMNQRKVAGSAQRRKRTGILHQGSIHFGGPLPVRRSALSEALQEGFRKVLNACLQSFSPAQELIAMGDELVNKRYARDEWNRRC